MILPLDFQNDDPLSVIQNLKDELQKNIDQNDAIKITESCFAHAHHMELFRAQSPLEELRKGNLEKAVALTELHDDSNRYIWKLLLIWELKEEGKIKEARNILKSLSEAGLNEFYYYFTAPLVTYLLSRCADINDAIIFLIVEEHLKKEDKIQFFKYLLSDKSSDGNLIANAVLNSVNNQERVKSLKLYMHLAQQEISDNAPTNIFASDTYLAKSTTLLQIDKALKIEDEYEKALTLSKILPKEYCPSEDFESEDCYEYEFYLMTHLLPAQAITTAETGEIDAALNIMKFLLADGSYYDNNVAVAIANQQAKNGKSQEARNTIDLVVRVDKEDGYSSYFDRIRLFGQHKRDKEKYNPTAELMEVVLFTAYMRDRLLENKDMREFLIDAYLFPEDKQAKKDFITLLDFILYESKQNPNRRQRIHIIGKAAVVQAKSGDVVNALKNLDYLTRLIEEIPGETNKITAFLEVAEYYALAGQTDEALNTVNKASQLAWREQRAYRRDYDFQEIAYALIHMGLYEMAIDTLRNISSTATREMILRDIAIDRIEKLDDGIPIAEELMAQIRDQYYRDQIMVKMAEHHIKKGDTKRAQRLVFVIESEHLNRIVLNQILLAEGDKSTMEKQLIDNDLSYGDAENLAIGVMKAGLGELALRITNRYSTEDVLFELADICLQIGDQETFNKIITIASTDRPSACKIAGLICRKYPDSARDIYNTLLDFEVLEKFQTARV